MQQKIDGLLVPKLRFPEFLDVSEWEKTTIGDIGSFYYGKSAPKWSLKEDAPTRCVRYGELYTKFGAIIAGTYSRTNIDPKNLRFSKGGEILVPRVGEKPEDFGKCCCYLPLANIAIGEMISVFETSQNPLFYTYYFRNLYREFAKVVEGQNVKNLYYVELQTLPIHRPPLQEQQKIADCLTSLDDRITLEAQKLDTLKVHKKGLMQQLFPAEGETLPKLRFPEFQDAGEWEEKKLKEVSVINQGLQIPISERFTSQIENSYFYITNEFLKENSNNLFYIKNPSDSVVCDKDDILMTRTGNTGQVVTGVRGVFHNNFFKIKLTQKIDKDFFVYFLRSQKTQTTILKLAGSSTIPDLNHGDFYKITIELPCITEQQKIADCLSSLDELIAAQTQAIDTLKTHKKGLMQQLFPSVEEVKG